MNDIPHQISQMIEEQGNLLRERMAGLYEKEDDLSGDEFVRANDIIRLPWDTLRGGMGEILKMPDGPELWRTWQRFIATIDQQNSAAEEFISKGYRD